MFTTYASESIAVGAAAVDLDENASGNVRASPPPDQIEISVSGASLRYRVDGTAPTASVGELLYPTDRLLLDHRNDMLNFQAIRTGSTNAAIWVRFKRKT